MARFNEILSGRFNRALQKLLSRTGGPPAAQLATEIATNIQFNQMGNDFRYLEGWDIFGNQVALAASVGNTAGYRLRNPAGSNCIAVVEKVSFESSLGTDVIMRVSTALNQPGVDLGNVASGAVLDLRSQRVPGSTIIPSNANPSVAFGAPFYRWSLAANANGLDAIVTDNQELLILPGTAIQFETNVVNTAFAISARWRERFLEDSERT
jgi:hypothetical protein